jgi:hypothetical protein
VIAVALFLLIPGVVVNSPAVAENTASIDPNLSKKAKNEALPIPAIDFRANQYFRLSCVIGIILIGSTKFKLLSTDLELKEKVSASYILFAEHVKYFELTISFSAMITKR